MPPRRILFVCTGNICRSPTAEGLFRARAEAAGLDVTTDSCGVSAEEAGNPPDPRAVAEARRRGIALPRRRARQVLGADFAAGTWLVGMTTRHCRALEERRPQPSEARIRLLLDFAPGRTGEDVPDPWYGPDPAAYALAFELIEEGVDGLIRRLLEDGA